MPVDDSLDVKTDSLLDNIDEIDKKAVKAIKTLDELNKKSGKIKDTKIKKILTGADRIALNGDSANKIGTYSIAALGYFHRIPFYIAAPYSTFDPYIKTGDDIPIEIRSEDEITIINKKKMSPKGTRAFNPAFDVVPARLINGIVTEKGIISRPNKKKILLFIVPFSLVFSIAFALLLNRARNLLVNSTYKKRLSKVRSTLKSDIVNLKKNIR